MNENFELYRKLYNDIMSQLHTNSDKLSRIANMFIIKNIEVIKRLIANDLGITFQNWGDVNVNILNECHSKITLFEFNYFKIVLCCDENLTSYQLCVYQEYTNLLLNESVLTKVSTNDDPLKILYVELNICESKQIEIEINKDEK